ncbi:ABC transporter substrate-binding protein [Corynebacterium sp. 13CS0277]|uniref:metal ABC transporter solute-binding protein, Zn/Mn family n=1 Tax=Corynebacterium sp. 13CS0277 TaxID=2071994 RepID=UPI000D036646|nr:zinc ABC transporter substrate-binding protein [Corynebacterium sp. 13CS0277]PRQ11510.1 ABC transporter substrate-binding protein [Corynebacterium sp. 13CS0277]
MKLTRILAAAALLLTGCSAAPEATDEITIVTSTQIWADIAHTVAPDVDAHAIITGNETDPHSFEPTAADMAQAKKADIVIVGGGGYDAWLYSALPEDTRIIHALPLVEHEHEEGHDHDHGEEHGHGEAHEHGHDHEVVNEHIWYDIDAVDAVAQELATALAELDPATPVDASAVAKKLAPIRSTLNSIPAATVLQTEPIADYLIAQTKLRDVTPEGYRDATLDEQEPSARDVAEVLDGLAGVDILIFNPQTATPTTEKIRAAAEAAGVRVVEISETPAAGENYFEFFAAAADRLAQ